MRALVTGVAGFIGSHLAQRLLEVGWEVVGIDNFDPFYPRWIKERNLAEAVAGAPRFSLVEGDVRAPDALLRSCADRPFDLIVHLAGHSDLAHSLAAPREHLEVNALGTLEMLEFSRRCGCRRFLLASSCMVYGSAAGALHEEHSPTNPLSPYAVSKLAAEQLCQVYSRLYGIDAVALRLWAVYGSRQRPGMAISTFVGKILRNEVIELYGEGELIRDYVSVEDTVTAFLLAAREPSGSHLFNIGTGQPVSGRELVGHLERALDRKAQVRLLPARAGEPESSWPDIGRAHRLLGFRPAVTLAEGIARFVEWHRTVSECASFGLPNGQL